jgi:acetoin utilization deacetylase AcuC-like enzyme
MGVTRRIAVVQDPRFELHRGPGGHPECPDRLRPVARALAERSGELAGAAARPATDEEILRVHSRDHLAALEAAVSRAPVRLDPDTYVSEASLEVARLAAGSTSELALAISRGEANAGIVTVRPPGHHAEASRAMGFCLLNNVAIAARALQAAGLGRLLILDWDVHHGNGTQHSFEHDPSVLYVSTHQFPYYPGTGDTSECGVGAGAGTTVNVPLPAGCGDEEYLGAFLRVLVPVARAFRPEFVLVSCGFDAHRSDPLAAMDLSRAGYAGMTHIVRALAEELCGGRVLFVLEGGYAAEGLYEGSSALLEGLLCPNAQPPATPDLVPGSLLDRALARVVAAQAPHHSALGAP